MAVKWIRGGNTVHSEGLIAESNTTGRDVIIVGSVFGFLAVLAVGLRIWARRLVAVSLDASDWTCIAGLVVGIALLGSTVNGVIQGLGQPIHEVSMKQLTELSKALLVGMFTWTASNTLIRISMLLLYIRLFPNRKFVIFSWAFLAENVVCAIATFIATSLICQPFAYNWDPINIKGRCGDKQKFYLWHGINNLLSDIIVTTMPMPLLWGLQLPLSKKISISLMFSMGIGICIITLVRTIEIARADLATFTEDYASIGVLSILEPLLGVINCTLPLLRPVFQRCGVLMKDKDKSNNSGSNRQGYMYSIGSKASRKKTADPYPLDTIQASRHTSQYVTGKVSPMAADWESTKELVGPEQPSDAILMTRDWDVEFVQSGGRVQ